jgi:hypothetical protein
MSVSWPRTCEKTNEDSNHPPIRKRQGKETITQSVRVSDPGIKALIRAEVGCALLVRRASLTKLILCARTALSTRDADCFMTSPPPSSPRHEFQAAGANG